MSEKPATPKPTNAPNPKPTTPKRAKFCPHCCGEHDDSSESLCPEEAEDLGRFDC
jgi:hypothetical protein